MRKRDIEGFPSRNRGSTEHPEKEWHPLIRFVGPEGSFGEEAKLHLKEFDVEDVDWFKSAGQQENTHHIISGINSRRKASSGYLVCTGVVALGFNPKLRTNVSFLTHQTSSAWKFDFEFVKQLRFSLRTFARQTDGTKRSLLIFPPPIRVEKDRESLEIIKRIILEELGVESDVAEIKEELIDAFDVMLDTEHARIFITYT